MGSRRSASARRGRGRPRGRTRKGLRARRRLYDTAIRLIAKRGYEAATLREIAEEAGVSPGLLYRYFPSKRAIVLALYEELSSTYAARAAEMGPGRWRDRFLHALRTSLDVLQPHRDTLSALIPILVGHVEEGIFAPRMAFSRLRVQQVFEDAVLGADDAPAADLASALGRILYLAHLAVILFWLLDKSRGQNATRRLLGALARLLPAAALALRLPPARAFVVAADAALREGLLDVEGAVPPE